MGGFEKFCWIVTILASLAAAAVLAAAVFVREFAAPQEAVLAAVGVGIAIVPYVFTRGIPGLGPRCAPARRRQIATGRARACRRSRTPRDAAPRDSGGAGAVARRAGAPGDAATPRDSAGAGAVAGRGADRAFGRRTCAGASERPCGQGAAVPPAAPRGSGGSGAVARQADHRASRGRASRGRDCARAAERPRGAGAPGPPGATAPTQRLGTGLLVPDRNPAGHHRGGHHSHQERALVRSAGRQQAADRATVQF